MKHLEAEKNVLLFVKRIPFRQKYYLKNNQPIVTACDRTCRGGSFRVV